MATRETSILARWRKRRAAKKAELEDTDTEDKKEDSGSESTGSDTEDNDDISSGSTDTGDTGEDTPEEETVEPEISYSISNNESNSPTISFTSNGTVTYSIDTSNVDSLSTDDYSANFTYNVVNNNTDGTITFSTSNSANYSDTELINIPVTLTCTVDDNSTSITITDLYVVVYKRVEPTIEYSVSNNESDTITINCASNGEISYSVDYSAIGDYKVTDSYSDGTITIVSENNGSGTTELINIPVTLTYTKDGVTKSVVIDSISIAVYIEPSISYTIENAGTDSVNINYVSNGTTSYTVDYSSIGTYQVEDSVVVDNTNGVITISGVDTGSGNTNTVNVKVTLTCTLGEVSTSVTTENIAVLVYEEIEPELAYSIADNETDHPSIVITTNGTISYTVDYSGIGEYSVSDSMTDNVISFTTVSTGSSRTNLVPITVTLTCTLENGKVITLTTNTFYISVYEAYEEPELSYEIIQNEDSTLTINYTSNGTVTYTVDDSNLTSLDSTQYAYSLSYEQNGDLDNENNGQLVITNAVETAFSGTELISLPVTLTCVGLDGTISVTVENLYIVVYKLIAPEISYTISNADTNTATVAYTTNGDASYSLNYATSDEYTITDSVEVDDTNGTITITSVDTGSEQLTTIPVTVTITCTRDGVTTTITTEEFNVLVYLVVEPTITYTIDNNETDAVTINFSSNGVVTYTLDKSNLENLDSEKYAYVLSDVFTTDSDNSSIGTIVLSNTAETLFTGEEVVNVPMTLTCTVGRNSTTIDVTDLNIKVFKLVEPEFSYEVSNSETDTVIISYSSNGEVTYVVDYSNIGDYEVTDSIVVDGTNGVITLTSPDTQSGITNTVPITITFTCVRDGVSTVITTEEILVMAYEELKDLYVKTEDGTTVYMIPVDYTWTVPLETNGTIVSLAAADNNVDDGRISVALDGNNLIITTTTIEGDATRYYYNITITRTVDGVEETFTQLITIALAQYVNGINNYNFESSIKVYGFACEADISATGRTRTINYSFTPYTYKDYTFERIATKYADTWNKNTVSAGTMILKDTGDYAFFIIWTDAFNEEQFMPEPSTYELWTEIEMTANTSGKIYSNYGTDANGTYFVCFQNRNDTQKPGYAGWVPTVIDSEFALPISDDHAATNIVGWVPYNEEGYAEINGFNARANEYEEIQPGYQLYFTLDKTEYYSLSTNSKEALDISTNGTLSVSSSVDDRVYLTVEDNVVYINTTEDAESSNTSYTFTITSTLEETVITKDITVNIVEELVEELSVYGYSVTATIVKSGVTPTTDFSYNAVTYNGISFDRVASTVSDYWVNGDSSSSVMISNVDTGATFFIRKNRISDGTMFNTDFTETEIFETYDLTVYEGEVNGYYMNEQYNGTYSIEYNNLVTPKVGYTGWVPSVIDPSYAIPVTSTRSNNADIVGWYPVSDEAKAEIEALIASLKEEE